MKSPSFSDRPAMTLVEMLVAMVATLILMAAVVQVFGAFGTAMTASRAALGTDARLRTAAARLRDDLAGVTVQMLPPRDPGQGEGYFELIEGPRRDADAASGTDVLYADVDDVLLFTTRSNGAPFVGRGPGGRLESTLAEVAWFVLPTPNTTNPVTYTLYRRQLLVLGYAGVSPFATGTAAWSSYGSTWSSFYNSPCDISARLEASPLTLAPNTLSDLTRRENRFLHNPNGAGSFPFPFVAHQAATVPSGLIFDASSSRSGEDVVLTNVVGFDVRVFDPVAPMYKTAALTALGPGDPGATDTNLAKTLDAAGGYVDLGHNVGSNALASGITPPFSSFGMPKSQLVGSASVRRTYCTWSTHYEANGVDDDSSGTVDQGTDGLDGNGNSLVDEGDEQETSPPYPYPLRGIEVRIRCYEPSSRQIRQMTVRQTFVPH